MLTTWALVAAATVIATPARAAAECRGKTATIVGTNGSDTIVGTPGSDVIAALGGNDTIDGDSGSRDGGADLICGGDGDDEFTDGGFQLGDFDGGPGTDTITNQNSVFLGAFGDTGYYASGKGTLWNVENATGTENGDFLAGGPGPNILSGGGSADTFIYFPSDGGNDVWDAGEGTDTAEFYRAQAPVNIDLAGGSASIPGFGTKALTGFENVSGSAFADTITGDAGNNRLYSYDEPGRERAGDTISGGDGNDVLEGGGGPVTLEGQGGDDRVEAAPDIGQSYDGGPGNDQVGDGVQFGALSGGSIYHGGDGHDEILAGSGNDQLFGGDGIEYMAGGAGDDTLDGGPGDNDTADGGSGFDTCAGNIEFFGSCAGADRPDDNTDPPPPARPVSDVSLTMTPDPDDKGRTVTYAVSVTNDGPDPVIPVIRIFVAGTMFTKNVECHGDFNIENGMRCTHATQLAAGERWRFNVDVTANGSATHLATAIPGERDPNWANNVVPFPESGATCPPRRAARLQEESCDRFEFFAGEVTQVIQNLRNDVPLIENKATYMRAHVRSLNGTVAHIKAQVIGTDAAGNTLPGSPLQPVHTSANDTPGTLRIRESPQRGELHHSYLFQLPRSWTFEEILRLEFKGVESTFECTDIGDDCMTTVGFRSGPQVSVEMFGVPWRTNKGVVHTPQETDMVNAMNQIKKTMPIPEDGLDWTWTRNYQLEPPKPGEFDNRPEHLNEIYFALLITRLEERCFFTCKTFYGALILPPVRGPAAGVGLSSKFAGYWQPEGGLTFPHEFGHAAGRPHTNCSGSEGPPLATNYPHTGGKISTAQDGADAFYGFEPKARPTDHKVYGPETGDVMSYCRIRWTSDYTFNAMLTWLTDTFPTERNTTAFQVGNDSGAAIVSGTLSHDGSTGTLDSVLHTDGGALPPTPGDYSIRFENEAGAEIATYPFTPDVTHELLSFAELFPAHADATSVVLLHGTSVLDELSASSTAPSITIDRPAPGTVLDQSSELSWTAADVDGDALTYTVEVSLDNGLTWEVLAVNWTDTSIPLDVSMMAASTEVLLRVTASDGFNSTSATAGPMTISEHRPEAVISQPASGAIALSGERVTFEGTGYDPEDGLMADDALQWSSDKDGALGTGASLEVPDLSAGTHKITLTATDSDGTSGTATTIITVYSAPSKIPKCSKLVATIVGTSAGDRIVGGSSMDVVVAGGGNDTVKGLAGNDVLCGGAGKDRLEGGAGADRLNGDGGRDNCLGGPQKDSFATCERRRQ